MSLSPDFSLEEPEPVVPPATEPEKTVAPAAVAPQAVAVVEVPAVVAPSVEPATGDKGKALQEERSKRKRASARAEFWEQKALEIKRSRDRIQDTLKLRGRAAPKITDEEIAELVKEAEKADGLGKPTELVLRRMVKAFDEMEVRLERAFRQREVDRAEQLFRRQHADFEDTLRRADIYEAITLDESGNWRDPVVGRAIYIDGEDNPAEAAYELAKRLLGEPVDEGDGVPTASPNGSVPTVAVSASSPVPAAIPNPTPGPLPQAPTTAEATREGARQVIERVNENSQRLRGIRMVRSAGEPDRVVLNQDLLSRLDRLMDENPDGFLDFMKRNPSIDHWYSNQM